MWKAHRYYRGELGEGDMPPDVCIEIALWDRFGWGPEQTDSISLNKLRMMFIVMEQERVSRHAAEKLGNPDSERMRLKQQAARAAEMRGEKKINTYDGDDGVTGTTNAKTFRKEMRGMGG
jgi:hypothetical protein